MAENTRSLRRRLDRLFIPLTVGPTVLWIAGVILYPTLQLLWSSLFYTNPITQEKQFVGLDNFASLIFENGTLGRSTRTSYSSRNTPSSTSAVASPSRSCWASASPCCSTRT
ncbi:hypothetical protein [Haladaptatus sp. W1]|uniref:hypothetical protein n=1 Tax=Haladaptatus sp. W1 TaxID=1897478 RepID=UPI000B1EB983|nr:hypothetical protein [Haladaptatus sp. W1]